MLERGYGLSMWSVDSRRPANIKLNGKKLVMDKRSSLFCRHDSDEEKRVFRLNIFEWMKRLEIDPMLILTDFTTLALGAYDT
jgi:hypothetical protein